MRRGRGKNPNENPGVAPVTQLELSQRSPKKRLIIAAVLLGVGLIFLAIGLFGALSQEEGWTEIESLSASAESVASDLTFLYELGASGNSAGTEYKALSRLYNELCSKAYQLFDADAAVNGVKNLYFINRHPGEVITVEPALYRAFEQLERAGSRLLYAAPYYNVYQNIFTADDDVFAAEADPYKNPEIADYFTALSVYTASEKHIRLELLGDLQVKLVISEEYSAFAAKEGIERYLDFHWARNAFAVDHIADALIAEGYTYGTVSSHDGFMRVLDQRDTEYSYNLYTRYDGRIYGAARMDHKGSNSIVFLHAYQMSESEHYYYAYRDGTLRHPYIDPADGLSKNVTGEMVSYSRTAGCAEVLLSVLPIYIAEESDGEAVTALTQKGIHAVYFDGLEMHYNDPAVHFEGVYQNGPVAFKAIKDE